MTQISLRVDEQVKTLAEQTCEELGISMSAAITVFLKKLGRERRIPFEVSVDPFYSEANMAELRRRIREIDSGKAKLVHKTMAELEAMEDE